jgi:hypothetical protein
MDKLENPIWYALTTSQIHLSQGDDLAGIASYKKVGFKESRTVNFQLVAKSQKYRNYK